VVLGMFSANSHAATVLFSSGATHSFISCQFVNTYKLPRALMKNRVLVSSPGGEMESRHVCPKISICIRGVDFLANLIILESKGIDIILGMDWLTKYKGVIRCATKTV
jgi:Retroviral aspartyl protease